MHTGIKEPMQKSATLGLSCKPRSEVTSGGLDQSRITNRPVHITFFEYIKNSQWLFVILSVCLYYQNRHNVTTLGFVGVFRLDNFIQPVRVFKVFNIIADVQTSEPIPGSR